ncbi:MAG: hypothetical protein K940chlam7_00898 [Chlamydiae bacterium]|nr:hypothetical protein [Chlamydiota bacterium]
MSLFSLFSLTLSKNWDSILYKVSKENRFDVYKEETWKIIQTL